MGCGQSQFSFIYPRKSKKKEKKNRGDSDDDDDEDDSDGERGRNKSFRGGRLISNKSVSNLTSVDNEEEIIEAVTPSATLTRPNRLNLTETVTSNNSPLFVNREMTPSQKEFFELLDERIENGPDYDEKRDTSSVPNNVRMKRLLNEWEKAKAKHCLKQNAIRLREQQAAMQQQTPPKQRRRILQHGFTTPHLNGDVFRPYNPLYCSVRQQTNSVAQTPPATNNNNNNNNNINNSISISSSSGNTQQSTHSSYLPKTPTNTPSTITFSNTIIQYDQLKGNFYTELA